MATKRTEVRLEDSYRDYADDIGGNNIAEGLRKALDLHRLIREDWDEFAQAVQILVLKNPEKQDFYASLIALVGREKRMKKGA